MPHRRRCDGNTKQTKQTKTASTAKNRRATHQDKQDTFHKNKTKKEQTATTRNNKKSSFEAAAEVCGFIHTSSIDGSYLLAGLVPCYPACRLPPAFVNRVFRASLTAVVVSLSCPPGGDAADNTKKQNKQKNGKHHQEQARHPLRRIRHIS